MGELKPPAWNPICHWQRCFYNFFFEWQWNLLRRGKSVSGSHLNPLRSPSVCLCMQQQQKLKNQPLKKVPFFKGRKTIKKCKLHITIKPGLHGVVKWEKAQPLPTSKSVTITTTCEFRAGFTWDHEMGVSTDYRQVISDHYHEWSNSSDSGGSAHTWRAGLWCICLDGVNTTTSFVFILQEP